MKKENLLLAALIVGVLSSCSASRPYDLSHAEIKLAEAKSDPFIVKNSPLELAEAEGTTYKAEMMWREKHDKDEVTRVARQAIDQIDRARMLAGKNATAKVEESAYHSRELLNKERQITNLQRDALDREATQRVLLEELQDIKDQDLQERMIISLNSDLLFGVDKVNLKPGAERQLLPLTQFLMSHPNNSVAIEGHTDNTGDTKYNQTLSEARARTVLSFLEQHGISSARVTAIGLGEKYPVTANNTNAGRLQNRRVEILISSSAKL